MLRSIYITRFLSFILLVVFALSITPKRFLHEIFAKHTDNKAGKRSDKPYQLSGAGFTCDNDNLVVESSFVNDQQTLSFSVFASFSPYIIHQSSFSSAFVIYSRLRGPPLNS